MATDRIDARPVAADSGALTRVLIAEASRVVRASLAHHIRGSFDIREATDGEAAWQAVLLDASIRIVLTGLALPKVDGFTLLTRVRSSKVQRIRELPVVVLSSPDETAERQRAAALGATDFIGTDADATQIVARLDLLVRLAHAHEQLADTQAKLESARTVDPETELLNPTFFDKQVEKLVSYARRNLSDVALICVRVELSMPGAAAWEGEIEQRTKLVGRTLAASIRLEDLGTRSDRAEFIVATQCGSLSAVLQFVARLRKVLENVEAAGPGVEVWTCIGVATLSEELRRSAEELRGVAQKRAAQAQASRSRRIMLGAGEGGASGAADAKPAEPGMDTGLALALIRAGRAGEVVPHLPGLIEQISPLLRLVKQQKDLLAQGNTAPGITEGTHDELQRLLR